MGSNNVDDDNDSLRNNTRSDASTNGKSNTGNN